MHRLNKQYSVRPEHVSAVSEVHTVPDRPNARQYEVLMVGGQTIEVLGTKDEMEDSLTRLIRVIDGA